MYRKRSYEQISKKCELLESMGFEIAHEDSSVYFGSVEFDFSATACDVKSLVYTALMKMQEVSRKHGKNEIRNQLRELMQLEEIE